MYGLTRGTMTLLGAATAGFLLWLASQTDVDGLGGYWTWIGVLAAAGLVMALSQLLGGWTKWGWPRLTGTVFLLGFLPALLVGGLVLLHAQPDSGWGTGLAGDLGLDGLADDFAGVLPALAFGLGLLFGFTFDTTGPRLPREATAVPAGPSGRARQPADHAVRPTDEPVAPERQHTGDETAPRPVGARTSSRDRDGDGVDDRSEAERADRRHDG